MDKLRIGIMVDLDFSPEIGGGYSYYNRLLKAINNHQFSPCIEVVNIVFHNGRKPDMELGKPVIYIKCGYGKQLKNTIEASPSKAVHNFFSRTNKVVKLLYNSLSKKKNRETEDILRQNNVDLVYYLKPSKGLPNYPYILTHWDVGYRSMHAFPETSMEYPYESNINYYSYILGRAFMIFCESQAGAAELKKAYSIFPDKVKVLPIFAGEVINCKENKDAEAETLKKYSLEKEKFFLYPAQFWPHKNHYNLLLAFKELLAELHLSNEKLVLCGSDMGNLRYIQRSITAMSLQDKVVVAGFLPTETLYHLYKNAISLVMPTFLGPTNLPLIEAAHLECPVLCSDLEGHRELLADNALYFDPSDVVSIKGTMKQVLHNEFRSGLRASAKLHIDRSPFNIENCLQELDNTLKEAMIIRRTWGKIYPE